MVTGENSERNRWNAVCSSLQSPGTHKFPQYLLQRNGENRHKLTEERRKDRGGEGCKTQRHSHHPSLLSPPSPAPSSILHIRQTDIHTRIRLRGPCAVWIEALHIPHFSLSRKYQPPQHESYASRILLLLPEKTAEKKSTRLFFTLKTRSL